MHALRPAALAGLVLLACAAPQDPAPIEPQPPAFEAEVQEALAGWQEWPVVGDYLRWAVTDCRIPPPPRVQQSQSRDEGTHGQKLYVLRSSHSSEYLDLWSSDQVTPIGQTLVKQTWIPIEMEGVVTADPLPRFPPGMSDGSGEDPWEGFHRELIEEGRGWRTGDPGPVFFMHKLAPGTPGTDYGWVYGSMSPEGHMYEVGAIASCMLCHNGAGTRNRQFGPRF